MIIKHQAPAVGTRGVYGGIEFVVTGVDGNICLADYGPQKEPSSFIWVFRDTHVYTLNALHDWDGKGEIAPR